MSNLDSYVADNIDYSIINEDVALEDIRKAGQWISADDHLPEEGDFVLVWYEYFRYGDYNRMWQTYGIGYQYKGFWSGDVQGERAKCLYWMPLPKPPKGE